MSMYEAEGKIKFMQNYADPGEKPNWYVIINDMDDGKFVSDEVVNEIIQKVVFDPKNKNRLIFDGYPRS
mgnify:CR=1 FL=1